jgi:hypothetical protein
MDELASYRWHDSASLAPTMPRLLPPGAVRFLHPRAAAVLSRSNPSDYLIRSSISGRTSLGHGRIITDRTDIHGLADRSSVLIREIRGFRFLRFGCGRSRSMLHTRRILFSKHDFSSQRARSSKEATEADAFLCDLDPSLCALCVSTPLLWLRLRRARKSVVKNQGLGFGCGKAALENVRAGGDRQR